MNPTPTTATPARCDAVLTEHARPRLAPVEAARIAGRPIPATDWRCVRKPHTDHPTAPTEHLAMPLGPTGPTHRFDDADRAPCPACGTYPAPADAAGRLADQLTTKGVAVVRVEPGDCLLLLMPPEFGDQVDPADPDSPSIVTQTITDLARMFPGVSFLGMPGVTGAAVIPPTATSSPASTVESVGPTYAHRLLDAMLDGLPLDFRGAAVPEDLRARIESSHLPRVGR